MKDAATLAVTRLAVHLSAGLVDGPAAAVPEPGSLALVIAGIAAPGVLRKVRGRRIERLAAVMLALASAVAAVEPGRPSRTAIGAGVGRAIGAKNPNPEFRNPDFLAEKFLGPRERALITDFRPGSWTSTSQQPWSGTCTRSW